MTFVSSKSLKYPTKPLLKRTIRPQPSEDAHFLFSNEPREVIMEFARLMKEEGIIITGDDIAKVSPLKKRKDSSDSEEDLPTPEAKNITGKEGASDALVSKGKEPVVSGTTAATPKRKRADKEKVENVVEKKKEKVTKKQRTHKKKEPKIVRKLVVHEEDNEETDEEPLKSKRKRT
ncbi:hypothetical protein A2U01_0037486 [Trifolium medium]|uniref:Uncharacterized protein n=1 Tax=Trifolium medium TaxID=97028 RepID=A0A392PWZ9_9FABA|nr:hypothetical protein [Trifolium medium]